MVIAIYGQWPTCEWSDVVKPLEKLLVHRPRLIIHRNLTTIDKIVEQWALLNGIKTTQENHGYDLAVVYPGENPGTLGKHWRPYANR